MPFISTTFANTRRYFFSRTRIAVMHASTAAVSGKRQRYYKLRAECGRAKANLARKPYRRIALTVYFMATFLQVANLIPGERVACQRIDQIVEAVELFSSSGKEGRRGHTIR
jgi:hypothetical protein